jgi:NAD(P)-dependent dehydrogenase (short-subunit alcohol dehydrogenase family)
MRKRIIITGATSGIGLATLEALAGSQYEILLGVRDTNKAKTIANKILSTNKNAKISIYQLDLASLESIQAFSEAIHKEYQSIDILFNNAGVFSDTRQKTKQGFEMTLGVNYIGTYYLTILLKDILEKGNQPQIISVGSRAGLFGRFKYKEGVFENHAHGFRAYSASKYLLLLTTIHCAQQFEDCGIRINIVHPGDVATNIWEGESTIMKIVGPIMKKNLLSIEEGAVAGLHLIENRPNTSGGFYKMHGEVIPFNKYDAKKAKDLLERTNDAIVNHGYHI